MFKTFIEFTVHVFVIDLTINATFKIECIFLLIAKGNLKDCYMTSKQFVSSEAAGFLKKKKIFLKKIFEK